MIRRAFVRRMMGAALASGLLGAEILRRAEQVAPRWSMDATGVRNVAVVHYPGGSVRWSAPDSVEWYGERVMIVDDADSGPRTPEQANMLDRELVADFAFPDVKIEHAEGTQFFRLLV